MIATAGTRPRGLAWRMAWLTDYRDLLWALLRRELRVKYKGSTLGIVWSYIHPLVMMGVYTLVFSVLWRAVSVPHYPVFVLTGLAVWAFFQAALHAGAASVVRNGGLIQKVAFAREVIPAAVVLAQAATAVTMFAVLVPIGIVLVPETAATAALVVPFFAGLVCLALGLAWMLAAAHVFFRDVVHFLGVAFLAWFFLTPIFYSLDQLPGAREHGWLVEVMRYVNPVTPYVESIRGALLQATVPAPVTLAYVLIVGPAVALLGLWIFQRHEDQFAVEL